MRAVALALLALVSAGAPAAQERGPDLAPTLDQVATRIVEWYGRAQTIVSHEQVFIYALGSDLLPTAPPRRLTFELRVAWDPDSALPGALPEASTLRQLLTVNGRPPRPRDDPGCLDPKGVTAEPLSMLLPGRRDAFTFTVAERTRVNGRDALVLAFRSAARERATVTWAGECVSISLPGWSDGRIWIDAGTHDVLRLDERLSGQFDFAVPIDRQRRGAPHTMTIERAESSIRYAPVRFDDPPETLMLPTEVDRVTIVRGGGIQRHRIVQRYSDHRRFLTDVRVVP